MIIFNNLSFNANDILNIHKFELLSEHLLLCQRVCYVKALILPI